MDFDLLKEPKMRKRVIIVATAALCLVTALSFVRCSAIHQDDGAQQDGASEAPSEQVEVEEHVLDVEPTDEQLRVFAAMEEPEEQFLSLFASQLWTTRSEGGALEVTKYALKENGVAFPYAVCDVDEHEYAYTTDGVVTEVKAQSACVLLEDGSYSHIKILTKNVMQADGTESVVMSVESPLFKNSAGYQRASAASDMSVEGPSESILQFMGTSGQSVERALREYCSVYYPTADHASWTGQLTYDRDTDAYGWAYRINNTANTLLNVTFDGTEKAYSIK